MADLLERVQEATRTSRDPWLDPQWDAFDDRTPVSRPTNNSDAFALLVALFGTDDIVVPTGTLATPADTHPGTAALEQLRDWLQLPLDRIVALVGLSASTRAYWRHNPGAPVRASKCGRLLRFRDAVGLLVGAVGADQARAALNGGGWLAVPLDESRLSQLEGRVRGELLPAGLVAPAGLGTASRDELRRRALEGTADELSQQRRERAASVESGDSLDASEGP